MEKTSTSTDYDDFIADLPENECRWGVYDLEFQKEDGGQRNKIIFYQWYVVFNPIKRLLPARAPLAPSLFVYSNRVRAFFFFVLVLQCLLR